MKLRHETKTAGFYESFSDIIFATMAIFILLMTVFLVLAKVASPIKAAEKKLQSLEEQIEQTETQTQALQQAAKPLEKTVDEASKRRVEIAIVVDKSASMEQELYNLKNAIYRLADLLPKVMDQVRISVVSYRVNPETGRDETELFPMQAIQAAKQDNGQSVRKLKRFLARQTHQWGAAPILEASDMAIRQFSTSSQFDGHQVFMILGDVGPFEEFGYESDDINAKGRRKAEQLVGKVSGWVKSKKHRNLIVLFSGQDEIRGFLGSTNARREKHRQSMILFKRIATESGQADAYTENQASMFVDFLVAALKRK